ncbi:MAG TPA: DUF4013 domain-containing protein [Bellilinea sp.]|nr:DUF4013 domain-containing protein [Bellilinea sp.]
MDLGKAFSFPFDDQDWFRKIGIVSLLQLIPIFGQLILTGWTLQTSKNVIDGVEKPLPDMDLGRDIITGLKAFVVGIVYFLPVILLGILLAIGYIPLYSVETEQDITPILGLWATALGICIGSAIFLYSIFMTLVLPAAYTNMMVKGNLSAAFELRAVWGHIKRNPGAYILVFLGVLLVGFLASFGVVLCIIGVILTSVYAQAVSGHLYGQAHLASAEPGTPELVYQQ